MPDDNRPDAEQLRDWLLATANRDTRAFHALYDATAPRLFGFALGMLGRHALAEEALEDAFVTIWHAPDLRAAAADAPFAWMAGIVRDRAMAILQRAGPAQPDPAMATGLNAPLDARLNTLLDALEDPIPSSDTRYSPPARELAFCMAQLEGGQRRAIGHAFFHALPPGPIATRLALPTASVKPWIRRGLDQLKHCLGRAQER
ncbi:sigma factor [Pseudoduganella flava]|uniref:RNA polymerase subunit sigma n=1 Tax=Pseudoduganella flava TaxID=871742 RepID=A0ABX6FTA9_9BURK|nr:sigma factor [Pseudoduganella flava]QGZ39728.1 RNA polymerase subunit sigma [Pseudoduganella flava]